MAERTGRKQAEHSAVDPAVSRRNEAHQDTPQAPNAPGATASPQHPGEVPDQEAIPGHSNARVAAAATVRRPLSEEGTAQGIMGIYAATPGHDQDPARFEQATASYEELRKAYPAQLPTARPAPGRALATGDAQASELQAIGGGGPTPSAPANAAGEAATAAPGAPTAAAGAPARSDAQPAAGFSPSDAPASVRSPSDATAAALSPAGATGPSAGPDAAPAPGDAASPGGILPAAKDG